MQKIRLILNHSNRKWNEIYNLHELRAKVLEKYHPHERVLFSLLNQKDIKLCKAVIQVYVLRNQIRKN